MGGRKPADYAYGLTLDANGSDALYEVTMPVAVYQGIAYRDLTDVRLFNGANEVVPHAWRPRRTEKTEAGATLSLPLFALKAPAGGSLDNLAISVRRDATGAVSVDVKSSGESTTSSSRTVGYLIDLSAQERALRAIEFDWKAAEGFSGKLRIDVSDDLSRWRSLVPGAPLLNLEVAGQSLRQKRVELPFVRAKYLRLAWVDDAENRSPMPDIIAAVGELAEKNVEVPREWAKFSPTQAAQAGEYIFDLKGQFPVDRLRLELPELNTVVQFEVLVRDKLEVPWRSIARTKAYRLRQAGAEIVSPEFAVSAFSERWWMIRIDQRGGGLGSGKPILGAGWVPHQLVFAARGTMPFTLAYGKRNAQIGALPIETLVPGYSENRGASVRTARAAMPPVINVQPAQAQAQQPLGGEGRLREQIDWKRWSLWAVLGLGVLVLGGMAWRLMKQLGSPQSDGKN